MEKEVLMPATIAYVFSFKTETGYRLFLFYFVYLQKRIRNNRYETYKNKDINHQIAYTQVYCKN